MWKKYNGNQSCEKKKGTKKIWIQQKQAVKTFLYFIAIFILKKEWEKEWEREREQRQ